MPGLKDVREKISKISTHFGHSYKSTGALRTAQKVRGVRRPKQLVKGGKNKTRWWIELDQWERALELREHINEVVADRQFKAGAVGALKEITKIDSRIIETAVEIFEQIRETISVLERETEPSINMVVPVILLLKSVRHICCRRAHMIILNMQELGESRHEVAKVFLQGLDSRMKITPKLVACTLLDPRFRLLQGVDAAVITEAKAFIQTTAIAHAENMLDKERIEKVAQQAIAEAKGTAKDSKAAAPAQKAKVSKFAQFQGSQAKIAEAAAKASTPRSADDAVKAEMAKYFDPANTKYDWPVDQPSLPFWASGEGRKLRWLGQTVRLLLAEFASTAALERRFSKATGATQGDRASTSDVSLEMNLLLCCNPRLLHKVVDEPQQRVHQAFTTDAQGKPVELKMKSGRFIEHDPTRHADIEELNEARREEQQDRGKKSKLRGSLDAFFKPEKEKEKGVEGDAEMETEDGATEAAQEERKKEQSKDKGKAKGKEQDRVQKGKAEKR